MKKNKDNTLQELQMEIEKKKKNYVDTLINTLKKDPFASEYQINYKETREYLLEILEKDGSVLGGLITAMERHLNK